MNQQTNRYDGSIEQVSGNQAIINVAGLKYTLSLPADLADEAQYSTLTPGAKVSCTIAGGEAYNVVVETTTG